MTDHNPKEDLLIVYSAMLVIILGLIFMAAAG